jgi:hypothetical protein
MNCQTKSIIGVSLALLIASTANANVVDNLIQQYKTAGAGQFKADKGKQLWTQVYKNNKKGAKRSCAVCHTKDLRKTGQHTKTKKPIDPLGPSVNSERLTDVKKINKWFKRNCKWTLGRECTAQEKGDFLMYIRSQ